MQQIARHGQSVAQIAEVGVDGVALGVAEGFYLLRLAGAILDIARGGGPLEVGVEPDAIGWVEMNALHLTTHPLPLG